MAYIFLFFSILSNTTGQILMKYAADRMSFDQIVSLNTISSMARSPYVIGGVIAYVAGLFAWLVTLSKLELSVAYPFLAITYILVFAASIVLFKEPVNAARFVGVALIMAGILFISSSAK